MLAIAIVLGYAAGCALVFALGVLGALPFRMGRWTRGPVLASALGCGTLFALGLWIDGVPDHLERGMTVYGAAFVASVSFYARRDAKKGIRLTGLAARLGPRSARHIGAAVGLAGALPGGAADGPGKADDLRRGPEVQL